MYNTSLSLLACEPLHKKPREKECLARQTDQEPQICKVHKLNPSPLQPHHAEQIDDPDPEPVIDAVFRSTMQTRSMVDLNTGNFSAVTLNQRRQKPVHVIEGRQSNEVLAIKNFQATTRIPDSVFQ